MIIKSIEIKDFRNYEFLELDFDRGINILYGDNAEGKTNLLEAVYTACTSKSQKSSRDREMIRFGTESAHIKLSIEKKSLPYRIDVHLKKNASKGIALNGLLLRKASELFGIANAVIFSPEDLVLIKNGPSERRRFMDIELCQLNKVYVHNLVSYNKIVNQKNRLLKNGELMSGDRELLEIYNEQMVIYGSNIIKQRQDFIARLNTIIKEKHKNITDNREDIDVRYEPDTSIENFRENLKKYSFSEEKNMVSLVGPHKDDISFIIDGRDLRHYGSQGQQRTAVLSLKLAEISIVEEISGDRPVLLLDDVLSELDRTRQNRLLGSIGGIQSLITCTGLDDFVDNRFHIDKLFHVRKGHITGEN